jgi:hypothetical protein
MKYVENVRVGCGGELWSSFRYSVDAAVDHMQLRKLVFSPDELLFDQRIDIELILQNQPLLEHLELPRGPTDLGNLTSNDLPLLHTFSGHVQAATQIVPGRPVSNVSIIHVAYHEDSLAWDTVFSELKNSSATIKALSLDFHRPLYQADDALILNLIIKHFKTLQKLVFCTVFTTGPRDIFFQSVSICIRFPPQTTPLTFDRKILTALSQFRCLESIELSMSSPWEGMEQPLVLSGDIMHTWGEQCSSLRKVSLDEKITWSREDSAPWQERTHQRTEVEGFSKDLRDQASWSFLWRNLNSHDGF